MNQLRIDHLFICLNADGDAEPGAVDGLDGARAVPITEFVIDGQPLSALLDLTRDMGSSDCDLDLGMQRLLPAVTERCLQAMLALAKPPNQLGSDRTVLYRCHCGCDDCGVISARIQRVADVACERDAEGQPIAAIEWLDVGFEDGVSAPPDAGPCARRLPRLVFELRAYEQAVRVSLGQGD